MIRRPFILLTASLLFALLVSLIPNDSQAQGYQAPQLQSGSDVLAAVNSLRAAYGLPAYTANSILMQIAQAHADYLAATGGAYGHTGPGGTRPIDRAVAAGYPAVFFSENWQSGSGMSASGAVSAWTGDAPHLTTMVSPSLIDAGAGVSKAGSVTYFVLDAGSPGGTAGNGGTTTVNGTVVPLNTVGPSQFMVPVTLNTPNADGLVFHEVAYGQSLWSIAIAYGTKIDSIRALNNLGSNDVYVGQNLLVLKGPTPVPTTPTVMLTETALTLTPSPTATRVFSAPTTLPTLPVTAAPRAPARGSLNLTAIAIIGAALLFAVIGTWAGTRKTV